MRIRIYAVNKPIQVHLVHFFVNINLLVNLKIHHMLIVPLSLRSILLVFFYKYKMFEFEIKK